ncbi:MAG TPA: hypothetical protein VG943_16520 [Caulobacterales bacterium]|nr:hypothetical protein [Caulobacterales bacterium]
MRFASLVTAAAMVAAAPVVASATAPQMQSNEFVSAVRCAAYDSLPQFAGQDRDLGLVQLRLNVESRRQSTATVEQARTAVANVAAQGASGDLGALRQERAAACSGSGALVADRAAQDGDV